MARIHAVERGFNPGELFGVFFQGCRLAAERVLTCTLSQVIRHGRGRYRLHLTRCCDSFKGLARQIGHLKVLLIDNRDAQSR
jgi:hypothetical protein